MRPISRIVRRACFRNFRFPRSKNFPNIYLPKTISYLYCIRRGSLVFLKVKKIRFWKSWTRPREHPDLGSGGNFHCYCLKRVARKLHRIILLHFRLVTFRTHFRKTRKPFMSMVFGTGGPDHDSQNQLSPSLELQGI